MVRIYVFNAGVNRYHLPVKNGTTPNNNLIEFKVDVFWMSLIIEDDKPVKPTNIILLCSAVKMICTSYFSDMVYAAFCHNLRMIISLTFCIIGCTFVVMLILAVE